MDYTHSFHVSGSGMAVEKLRLDVTAANIANMHVSAASPEGLYRPLRVVARDMPLGFASQFQSQFESLRSGGVAAVTVQAMDVAPRMALEPGHPHANDKGYVAYPGVSHQAEMINMVSALRAYEANVVAMNAARTMATRALDIGGQ
jgi:flagellar basal-body rod protein FlgC